VIQKVFKNDHADVEAAIFSQLVRAKKEVKMIII